MIEGLNKLKSKLGEKKLGKDWMLILILGGVLIAVIAWPTNNPGSDKSVPEQTDSQTILYSDQQVTDKQSGYEKHLEERLSDILSEIDGVGDVKVMITLSSDALRVVEKDHTENSGRVSETDSEGGTRENKDITKSEETVYITNNSGDKEPYISQTMYPAVEGVLVVAEGGDDINVNIHITEAIQALFHIEIHKIRVVKMKS